MAAGAAGRREAPSVISRQKASAGNTRCSSRRFSSRAGSSASSRSRAERLSEHHVRVLGLQSLAPCAAQASNTTASARGRGRSARRRDEFLGRQQAAPRMLPAQQRLGAGPRQSPSTAGCGCRRSSPRASASRSSSSSASDQRAAVVHGRLVDQRPAAAAFMASMALGAMHEACRRCPRARASRRCPRPPARRRAVLVERERLLEGQRDALRHVCASSGVLSQQHGELVARAARDLSPVCASPGARALAAACSRRSPTAWPSRLLMFRKRSRSSTSTASVEPVPADAAIASCTAASNCARLGRPVSVSR